MTVDRILIEAGRVAVSRPGYDVLTSPISSDFMAFDSGLPIERPLLAGSIIGKSIDDRPVVFYPRRYATRPVVALDYFVGNLIIAEPMRFTRQNGAEVWQGSYGAECYYDRFVLGSVGLGPPSDAFFRAEKRNWLYVVWATS